MAPKNSIMIFLEEMLYRLSTRWCYEPDSTKHGYTGVLLNAKWLSTLTIHGSKIPIGKWDIFPLTINLYISISMGSTGEFTTFLKEWIRNSWRLIYRADESEFDVIKDYAELADGDKTAWNTMMDLAQDIDNFMLIQGKNEDGEDDPSLDKLCGHGQSHGLYDPEFLYGQ